MELEFKIVAILSCSFCKNQCKDINGGFIIDSLRLKGKIPQVSFNLISLKFCFKKVN